MDFLKKYFFVSCKINIKRGTPDLMFIFLPMVGQKSCVLRNLFAHVPRILADE